MIYFQGGECILSEIRQSEGIRTDYAISLRGRRGPGRHAGVLSLLSVLLGHLLRLLPYQLSRQIIYLSAFTLKFYPRAIFQILLPLEGAP